MTTFRKDSRDGLYGLLTGFQAGYPTMLIHTYRRRPGSFTDKASAYVGSMPEAIAHTGGALSQRTMTPSVVFVMRQSEPASETADAMDLLVDAFITYANWFPHAISNQTVVLPVGVEDIELDAEGTPYPAAIVEFNTIALEGRGSRIAHVDPPTATPEAIVNAIVAAGFPGTYPNPLTATPEQIVDALEAAGFIVGVLDPQTATPEAICLALIAAGYMAAA